MTDVDVTTYSDDKCLGQACPSLANLEAVRGDKIDIEDGKVYVLFFFNTFYKGSYPVFEELSKLHDEKGEKVIFVAISNDAEKEKVEKFLGKTVLDENTKEQLRLAVPHITFDDKKVLAKQFCEICNFSVMSCPMAYIVKDKKIVWRQQFLQAHTMAHCNFKAQLNHVLVGEELESNGPRPVVEVEGEAADVDDMSLF